MLITLPREIIEREPRWPQIRDAAESVTADAVSIDWHRYHAIVLPGKQLADPERLIVVGKPTHRHRTTPAAVPYELWNWAAKAIAARWAIASC